MVCTGLIDPEGWTLDYCSIAVMNVILIPAGEASVVYVE
jgi:hypothetical protein